MTRRALGAGRQLKVCVVGAGVAGLRTADVLLGKGASVTVLEARDRVGGRVAQSDRLGYPVDLGPNFIHGDSADNPISKIARETNTRLHKWGEERVVFSETGEKVPDGPTAEISEAFWGIISDAFRYSSERGGSIPPERSLMDFVAERAAEKYPDCEAAAGGARGSGRRELLLREAEAWGGFVGGATDRQSLKFFWLEECIEGENPFVADTYRGVLDRIAAPALEGGRVLFGHAVAKILSSERTDSGTSENPAVVVEASNGFKEAFDEVIVTVPLGYLKKHKEDLFSPPLSSNISRSIEAMGYGTLDKVYVTFPTAFWEQQPSTNGNDEPLEPNPSSPSYQYPGFTLFASPSYAPSTNPHRWCQTAVNLAAVPAPNSQPTLQFFIFGDCAQHIAKLVSESSLPAEPSTESHASSTANNARNPSSPGATHDHTTEALLEFFAPYFSRLPSYDPTSPSCKPVGALATAWAADEYAGCGSYTNFQIGLKQGDRDVETIREGMPERGVWLAGEHVAPFAASGTVTGAWLAGDEVANRISKAHGL